MVTKTGGLGRGINAILQDVTDSEDPWKQLECEKEKVADLSRQVELLTSGKGFMSAEVMYNKALAWKNNNPIIWSNIVADARIAAMHEQRFSMKKEIEDLRSKKWIIVENDDEYKFQNSYTATLTRFLFEEVPEVEPFVRTCVCKTDKFFGR